MVKHAKCNFIKVKMKRCDILMVIMHLQFNMGVADKIMAGGRVCTFSLCSAYRDLNIPDNRQYI